MDKRSLLLLLHLLTTTVSDEPPPPYAEQAPTNFSEFNSPSKYLFYKGEDKPPVVENSLLAYAQECEKHGLSLPGIRHFEDWSSILEYVNGPDNIVKDGFVIPTGIRFRKREQLFLNEYEDDMTKSAFLIWDGNPPMQPDADGEHDRSVFLTINIGTGDIDLDKKYIAANDVDLRTILGPDRPYALICQYHTNTTAYKGSSEETNGQRNPSELPKRLTWTSRAAFYMTRFTTSHHHARHVVCPKLKMGKLVGKLWNGEEKDDRKILWDKDNNEAEKTFLIKVINIHFRELYNDPSAVFGYGFHPQSTPFFSSSTKKNLRQTTSNLEKGHGNDLQVLKPTDAFALCVIEFIEHCEF